jgi:hypothetical protein
VDEETESLVRFELENRFYYLFMEWPCKPVPPNLWRDGDGKLHYLSEMGLDHLKASVRRIEKDLKEFIRQRGHPRRTTEIVSILEPLARAKLEEVKAQFRKQAEV